MISEQERTKWSVRILAFMGLTSFAVTWRVWTPYRTYPEVPWIPWLHPSFVSVPVFAIACVGLLASLWDRFRKYGLFAFFLCTAFMVLEDQSRLETYVYIALVGSVCLLLDRPDCFRFGLIFVYFWAGLHKLNVQYIERVFPWVFFATRTTHWLSYLGHWRLMAIASAVVELSVAPLLLWKRGRRRGARCDHSAIRLHAHS